MVFGSDSAGPPGERFPGFVIIWPLAPARVVGARQKARDLVAAPGGRRALNLGCEGGGESPVAPPPRRSLGLGLSARRRPLRVPACAALLRASPEQAAQGLPWRSTPRRRRASAPLWERKPWTFGGHNGFAR